MNSQSKVKVFIGSGEASRIERKTAILSLRKHTTRPLDIYVINGTHNSIQLNDEEPFLAPMSLRVKYRNITEFSLYRYLIPELCNYQGRAIYVDSDTICLADVGELFDTPMEGADFLAKYEADEQVWGMSVVLVDCEKSRFDLETIIDEIDAGLYSITDFSRMSQRFLAHHPYKIGRLDPAWNDFDKYEEGTKLIHYTALLSQPWKYHDHPYGELWFRYFYEALASGYITDEDVHLSIIRSYVRPDLLDGNSKRRVSSRKRARQLASKIKRTLNARLRTA